jgi:YegS/Rv2252/BmrU family lipid kinase
MTIAIILNGRSKKKRFFFNHYVPKLGKHFDISVHETEYGGHAITLAKSLTEKKVDVLLAAGGDGTLNQVVNGTLLSQVAALPTIGLIPLGTANDFAKSIQANLSVEQLISWLLKNNPKQIDIGLVFCKNDVGATVSQYFLNACSVGMGPMVVEGLEKNRGRLGNSLSYLFSILSTFLTHKPQHVIVKNEQWRWEGKARVVAIANGMSFGDGIYIAPDANIDDGLLNYFVAGEVSLLRFLRLLAKIKKKKTIKNNQIYYGSITSLDLLSNNICAIETDGEIIGVLPARIEIKKAHLKFLIG